MEFRLGSEKIKEQDLKDFENKYCVKLPQSFKDFYLENNGGIPSVRHFENERIAAFASIKNGRETGKIETIMEVLQLDNRLPEKFIPFAFDSGGWNFCINLNDSGYGGIYILPNGIEDNNPRFITESFETFINALTAEHTY